MPARKNKYYPLFMTYYKSFSKVCSGQGRQLTAQTCLETEFFLTDVPTQSCYWVITVPKYRYRAFSKLRVWVNSTQALSGTFYLYEGQTRRNATAVDRATEDQPFEVHADSGAIVVFLSDPLRKDNAGHFEYEIIG